MRLDSIKIIDKLIILLPSHILFQFINILSQTNMLLGYKFCYYFN